MKFLTVLWWVFSIGLSFSHARVEWISATNLDTNDDKLHESIAPLADVQNTEKNSKSYAPDKSESRMQHHSIVKYSFVVIDFSLFADYGSFFERAK